MCEIAGLGDGSSNHLLLMVQQRIQVVDERLHFRRVVSGHTSIASRVNGSEPVAELVERRDSSLHLRQSDDKAHEGEDREGERVRVGGAMHQARPGRIANEDDRHHGNRANAQPRRPQRRSQQEARAER